MLRIVIFCIGLMMALPGAWADAWEDCGKYLFPDRSIPACTEIITKGHETRRSLAILYDNRGNAYEQKNDHDKAIADYNKAIELDPKYAKAYNDRGNAYVQKGGHDKAIADYSKAIELNPKDDDAYTGRAWSYFKAGKAAQGLPDAERSLELYPHNAHALDTRGHIFEALGRREEAIADYRKTLVLDPGEEGKEDLKRLGAPITDFANQGMSILKASDNLGGLFLSNAQAAFEARLKVDAKDADCLYGRGLIKLKKGDTDGGNADITAAKAIDPRVAELWTSYYGIKSPRL